MDDMEREKKKGEGKKRNSIIISSFLYHLSIRYYVQNDIQITNNAWCSTNTLDISFGRTEFCVISNNIERCKNFNKNGHS